MAGEPTPKNAPVPVLNYATPTHGQWGLGISPRQREIISEKATRWAFCIAGLWLLLVLGMAGLVVWVGMGLTDENDKPTLIFLISIVAAMVLSEAALLFIPVRVATRRPVTRRSMWPGVIAGGFLIALLFYAGIWASIAAWKKDNSPADVWIWIALATAVAIWIGWAVFFLVAGRQRDPLSITYRMQEYLIHGSVLELLVAISAHVIVRNRGDCCATVITLTGIAAGAAVMLLAFGPAVFILLYHRCQSLRPRGVKATPIDPPPDSPAMP
jgi:biotin transporter BioY